MTLDRPTDREVVEATVATEATMRPQSVPVNMYETSAAIVIVAPMVAVTGSDVCVEFAPGTLRFWAHLRSAAPREYLLHEWEYGGYERQLAIPDGFGRAIEASLVRGQLVIRVLRGEPSESVTIQPVDGS